MSKISIELTKSKGTLPTYNQLESDLRSLYSRVESVRNGLRYQISGREAITARLREAAEQINQEANGTRAMKNGLGQIIARYEQTENANRERVVAKKKSIQQSSTGVQSTDNTQDNGGYEFIPFKWSDLLVKEISKLLGPFGFIVTGGKNIIEGNWWKAGNEFLKSLGDVVKTMIDKPTAEWAKNLFGGNKVTATPSFKSKLGDFSTLGKGVGTVVKWATSLTDSAIQNLKEFGNDGWKNVRFWEETFAETGIKILEGAAIATGVSAAAVAIMGSAPAVLVGLATAATTMAVDWGLNNLISWATNGEETSWVEAVSDFVCNTGEKIVNTVGTVVTKVADTAGKIINQGAKTIKSMTNAIEEGIGRVGEGLSNLFSGCRWGQVSFGGGGW